MGGETAPSRNGVEQKNEGISINLPSLDVQVTMLKRLGLTEKTKISEATAQLGELVWYLKENGLDNGSCLIVPNKISRLIVDEMMKLEIIKWERQYGLKDALIAHIESIPFVALQDIRTGGSGQTWSQYKNGRPGVATGHKCILSLFHTPTDKKLWCSPGTKGEGGLPTLKYEKGGLSLSPCFPENDSDHSVVYLTYGKRRFVLQKTNPQNRRSERILV